MADLHEIEGHLIEHPDDHEERWRLTKKLYMACEYRDALSHLLILKRNSEWKLNHSRYLAATYYRLGRYEESIQELREAISQWPHEIPIREQLARAYEVSDKAPEAVRVWQEILEIDPQHPIAAQSVQRLTSPPIEPSSESELHLNESDSGIDLAGGTICPKCGARNSFEFDRCWQCHAILAAPGTPTPEIRRKAAASSTSSSWGRKIATLLIGFATVGLLCAGIYTTLAYAVDRPIAVEGFIVASSVDGLLDHEWFSARVAAGCTLLIAWPAILWLAAVTCCDRPVPFRSVLGISLLAAALTYLLLWLPFRMIPVVLAAPTVLTLLLIPLIFPVRTFRALAAWAVQIVFALLCVFGVFAVVANVATFNHLQTLTNLDAARAEALPEGEYTFSVSEFPARYTITWKGTDSAWVNSVGRMVRFTVTRESSGAPVTLEFLEAGHTLVYRQDQTAPFSFTHAIAPGRNYGLRLKSSDTAPVHVSITGLLVPEANQQ